jgi:hypothetical protein
MEFAAPCTSFARAITISHAIIDASALRHRWTDVEIVRRVEIPPPDLLCAK